MSEKKNRQAVLLTGQLVVEMDWFFREQSESDFGIDAHVEKFRVVEDADGREVEEASGQLLALQIKGGPSYFKEPSDEGWWFRFGPKKHRYWLNHALPVLVILVDIDAKTAYWQEVSARTVKSTGKKFKIEVPRSHELGQANPVWSELAGGLERVAANRFEYSLTALPPNTRKLLENRGEHEKQDAALLAMHLAHGRSNAHGTVTSLQAARPAWLERAGNWGWAAIGSYASSHELTPEAVAAYVEAANRTEPGRRSHMLLAAATQLLTLDETRSAALMAQADEEARLGLAPEGSTIDVDRIERAAARTLVSQIAGETPDTSERPTSPGLAGPPRQVRWTLDPILAAGGLEVDQSASAQHVLALYAESRDDLDSALQHARAVIQLEPQSSSAKLLAARVLIARSTEPTGRAGDVRAAVDMYEAALTDRAPWSGPSREIRYDLANALMGAGRFEEVIKLTLPVPFGKAGEHDLHPETVRLGARAAAIRGRRDVVEQAIAFLGEAPADRLLRVSVGDLRLTREEVTALRVQVVDHAMALEQWEDALRAALPLLRDGVDVRDRLSVLAERGLVEGVVVELGEALLQSHQDLDAAIPKLRALARRWTPAAQNYLAVLRGAGRAQAAAAAALHLHQLTSDDLYLLERADALVDHALGLRRPAESDDTASQETGQGDSAHDEPRVGEGGSLGLSETAVTEAVSEPVPEVVVEVVAEAVSEAVDACRDALAVSWLHPQDRGRLLTFLGMEAADRKDWSEAERYTRNVLDLFEVPGDGNVWRNVQCLLSLGRLRDAARTIATYRPAVRDLEEAQAWLHAHSAARWSHSIALQAWQLSEEFADPRFSTAVAAHIISNTRGSVDGEVDGDLEVDAEVDAEVAAEVDAEVAEEDAQLARRRALAQEMVPGELHRRALELIATIATEHPEASGVQILKGETTDELIEVLTNELKRHAEFDAALEDVARKSLYGHMPVGMLAGLLGRSYATLVIQRGLGVLPASSYDDAEHELEVQSAAASLDRTVVLDSAAAVTLAGLEDRVLLTGRFGAVAVAPSTMHDLNSAFFDVRGLAGSPGTIRWDSDRQRIATNDLSEAEYVRLLRRAEEVQSLADRLNVLPMPRQLALLEKLAEEERNATWVDAIEVAHHHDVALYSDDLSLRRLARSLGLSAFGTPALIDAIRDHELGGSGSEASSSMDAAMAQHAKFNQALMRDYVVDLVVTPEELRALAEEDEYGRGPSISIIARPKWWAEHPDSIAVVFDIVRRAGAVGADQAAAWQWAAMHGTASALDEDTALQVLAAFALRGFSAEPTDEERAFGLLRARDVARDLKISDPTAALRLVAEELKEDGLLVDPGEVAQRIIALADEVAASAGDVGPPG